MTRLKLITVAGLVALPIVVIALYLNQPAGLGGSRLKAARSLALVCRVMAQDAGGVYPTARREIDADFENGLQKIWNPAPGVEYLLRPGLTESSPDDAILIYSKDPIRFGKHYVALKDSTGRFVFWEEIESVLVSEPSDGANKSMKDDILPSGSE